MKAEFKYLMITLGVVGVLGLLVGTACEVIKTKRYRSKVAEEADKEEDDHEHE